MRRHADLLWFHCHDGSNYGERTCERCCSRFLVSRP